MANTFQADGFDYDETTATYPPKKLTFRLADDTTVIGTGQPITLKAARQMIHSYWTRERNKNNLDANVSVDFGKETLLLLLARANCAGIRFYFCINQDERESLVLVGIDDKGNDLGIESDTGSLASRDVPANALSSADVLAEEVGGPKSLRHYLQEESFTPDPVGDAVRKFF